MSEDLVERLKDHALFNKVDRCSMFKEAAAEIGNLRAALKRCIVDLEASRLLAQHTLGEPHGINQTLAIARAALPSAEANQP
jgi:hypothetical protein